MDGTHLNTLTPLARRLYPQSADRIVQRPSGTKTGDRWRLRRVRQCYRFMRQDGVDVATARMIVVELLGQDWSREST